MGWSWFGIIILVYIFRWLAHDIPSFVFLVHIHTHDKQVLELLQTERYEVPFLWSYRRDYFVQHIPSREVGG